MRRYELGKGPVPEKVPSPIERLDRASTSIRSYDGFPERSGRHDADPASPSREPFVG